MYKKLTIYYKTCRSREINVKNTTRKKKQDVKIMEVYHFLNSLIILKVHNKLLGKSRLYSLHYLQIPLYFLKTLPSRTQSWHFLSLCTSRCLLSFSPFLSFHPPLSLSFYLLFFLSSPTPGVPLQLPPPAANPSPSWCPLSSPANPKPAIPNFPPWKVLDWVRNGLVRGLLQVAVNEIKNVRSRRRC